MLRVCMCVCVWFVRGLSGVWGRGERRKINAVWNHFTRETKIDVNMKKSTKFARRRRTYYYYLQRSSGECVYTFKRSWKFKAFERASKVDRWFITGTVGWIFFHLLATRNGQRAIKFQPYTSICHPDDTTIVWRDRYQFFESQRL